MVVVLLVLDHLHKELHLVVLVVEVLTLITPALQMEDLHYRQVKEIREVKLVISVEVLLEEVVEPAL